MTPGPDPQPRHPDLDPEAPAQPAAVAAAAELDDLATQAADHLDAAIETFLRNTGTRPNAATRAAARTILLSSRDYTELTASPPLPRFPGLGGVIVVPIPDRDVPPPPTTAQLDLALTEALAAHALNGTSTACACGWSQWGASHTAHVAQQLVKVVDRYTAVWMFNAGLATGDVHRRRTEERDRARDVAVALEQELAAEAEEQRSMIRTISDQAEQLSRYVAGARTPTMTTADGRVTVSWPLGRGNTIVTADLVEAWAARVNDQAATIEHLQKAAAELSDGWHTFAELYAHRRALFAAFTAALAAASAPHVAWRSRLHHDGTMFEGMFIVGVTLPADGQLSYHYELTDWDDFAHVPEVDQAPEFDGHTPDDVVHRLLAWATRTTS